MDRNVLFSQIFGCALSISVSTFVLLLPFNIPNKIYFSLMFAVLSYAVFEFMIDSRSRVILYVNKFAGVIKFGNVLFALFYISLIAFVMYPTSSVSRLYSSWFEIPPLNLMKLFSSVLLTMMFPGYAIMRILSYLTKEEFTQLEAFLFSFPLSFSATSLVGFICWRVYGTFEYVRAAFSIFNIAIVGLFLIFVKRNEKQKGRRMTSKIAMPSLYVWVILMSLVAFIFLINYSVHFAFPHIIGDEYDHLASSTQLLKNWRSWQSQFTNAVVSYPYWLHLHLSSLKILSGCPILNAYLTYFLIFPLPIFSFYYMVKVISNGKNQKMPILATVIFTISSGFGWMHALILSETSNHLGQHFLIYEASQKTFDIIYGTWLPILMAPYVIDLAIFFTIIALIKHTKINVNLKCTLLTTLITTAYLIHEINTIIFIFLLFIVYLFDHKIIQFPRRICTSILMGLLAVILIDLVAPSRVYLSTTDTSTPLLLFICILMIIASYVLVSLKEKYGVSIIEIKRSCKIWIFFFAVFAYIFSIPILIYIFPSFRQSFTWNVVPFYFFPLKLGITGFFALLGIFFASKQRNLWLNFVITLSMGTLSIDFLLRLSVLPIFQDLPEPRLFRDILWPFVCIIAAFGVIEALKRVEMVFRSKVLIRYACISTILLMLITTGIPNHLLKAQYYSIYQQNMTCSNEEKEAVNFIHSLHIPSERCILTVTPTSSNLVHAASGVDVISLKSYLAPFIFESKDPETALFMLDYLNIRYIYLALRDINIMEEKHQESFIQWLIKYSKIIFNNKEVTIYELPEFSPPVDISNFSIVNEGLPAFDELGKVFFKNVKWQDSQFTNGWQLFHIAPKNSTSWNFTSDGDICTIEGQTFPDIQSAVFYTKKCEISTDNSTLVTFRFKSANLASYAIVDIIYADRTVQRIGGYLLSADWRTITEQLYSNKKVVQVRLGVTDDAKGNGVRMKVFFDYIVFHTGLSNYEAYEGTWYLPVSLAAIMKLNYSTSLVGDHTQFKHKTLLITDLNFTDHQTQMYMKWVSSGGQLIVLNSVGYGSFAKLLNITVKNEIHMINQIIDGESFILQLPHDISVQKFETKSPEVKVVAYYAVNNISCSPFAFQRILESGKILYLDIYPIFYTINSGQNQTFRELLFHSLRDLSVFITKHVDVDLHLSSVKKFYVKNYGEINLQGNISISSSVVIPEKGVFCELIDFSNSLYTIMNGSGKITPKLHNVTLLDLEIEGAANVTLDLQGNSTILPLETGYAAILFNGTSNWIIDLKNDNAEVKITIKKNGEECNLIIEKGSIHINISVAQSDKTLIRNPSVTISGLSKFNKLYVSWPYSFRISGEKAFIRGLVEFDISLSSGSGFLMDNFRFEGELLIYKPGNYRINVPLSIIFLSSLFSFSIVFILFILIKQKNLNASIRLEIYKDECQF